MNLLERRWTPSFGQEKGWDKVGGLSGPRDPPKVSRGRRSSFSLGVWVSFPLQAADFNLISPRTAHGAYVRVE
jgi:hypothetical protein